jgi:hypothetical protein
MVMLGLVDLANQDPSLPPDVLELLRILSRTGTPAMQARGRMPLLKLESKPAAL